MAGRKAFKFISDEARSHLFHKKKSSKDGEKDKQEGGSGSGGGDNTAQSGQTPRKGKRESAFDFAVGGLGELIFHDREKAEKEKAKREEEEEEKERKREGGGGGGGREVRAHQG